MSEVDNLSLELQAPIKTFRVFAIEKIIKSGNSIELLNLLKQTRPYEEDLECQMLIDHAISTLENRLNKTKTKKIDLKEIQKNYPGTLPQFQLKLLGNLRLEPLEEDVRIKLIRFLLKNTKHPVVVAQIIKRFHKFWPKKDLGFFEKNLFAKSPSMQLASLEALINEAPNRLINHFEKLVLSEDPLIRAMAIRALAKKSPEIAAEFLADFLKKGEKFGKSAALSVCTIMPFNLVKQSLVEFILVENEPSMYELAGTIFIANPDKEIPYRLYDVMDKSEKKKKAYLNKLIKSCCSIIKASGICPDYPDYVKQLTSYISEKQSKAFIGGCLSLYQDASENRKQEIQARLHEYAETENGRIAMEKWLKNNSEHELSDVIKQTLNKTPEKQEKQEKQDFSVEEHLKAPPEKLLRTLINIRRLKEKAGEELISAVLDDKSFPVEIKAAALRAAVFVELQGYTNKAISWLKSENEDLISSSFEYLARFDSDSFFLQLRNHVNSRSFIVRTTLIKLASKQSPEVAKSILDSMLKDDSADVRKRGLGSIVLFEFSFVKELLLTYMEKEHQKDLLKICLSFFQMNPMLESVWELTQLSETSKYPNTVKNAIGAVMDNLEIFKIASREEIDLFISMKKTKASQIQAEEEDIQKKALEAIKNKIDWAKISNTFSGVSEYSGALKKLSIGIVLIIALFWFLTSDGGNSEAAKELNYQPVVAIRTDYKIIVQKTNLDGGSILAKTDKGKKLILLPRPGKSFTVLPGDKLQLSAMPFKKAPDGTLIVKTIKLLRQN